jgi:hypothetical protein
VGDNSKTVLAKLIAIEQRQLRATPVPKNEQASVPVSGKTRKKKPGKKQPQGNNSQSKDKRQHFLKGKHKQDQAWWTKATEEENKLFQQKLISITESIHEAIHLLYGFVADPTKSIQYNAMI